MPADASALFAISASGRLPNVLTITRSGCCIPALYAAGKNVGSFKSAQAKERNSENRNSGQRGAVGRYGNNRVTGRGGLTEKREQAPALPSGATYRWRP